MSKDLSLSIICPINQLGYGQVGINLTNELSKLCRLSLWPIGEPSVTNQKDKDVVVECLENAKMPDWNAPCIRLWHQNDMSQMVGRGVKIGFPIFELDAFNERELHHLRSLDEIFVCSEWAKKVVLNQVLCNHIEHIEEDRVSVVPLGVTPYPVKNNHIDNTTRFFTCGKWEKRKGHDKIIEAFGKAFGDDDDVELCMMCSNPFLNESQTADWHNLYAEDSSLGHKVRFFPRVHSHAEVLSIMAQMDCGIFISRAEGWNLELLEMMSCGVSVIATNYSGHTEFCNKDNSMLVEVENLEKAFDGIWFHGSGNWAELGTGQIDQIVSHMRNVHKMKQVGKLSINKAGIETAAKFSWEQTARKVIDRVKYI